MRKALSVVLLSLLFLLVWGGLFWLAAWQFQHCQGGPQGFC